jgi:integrase
MSTAAPSTALATIQPAFTDPERLALAGFLAGYRSLTREAYALLCRERHKHWTCVSSPPVAAPAHWPCSLSAAATSKASPGTWTRRAGPALISLLALNGLRVSEATGADIDQLSLERGHRTLTITRKGGKVVTIPLAPRTARAIDLAIGERTEGPVFLAADGRRLDRHGAGRIVRKVARGAGIGKVITPHTLRHAFITAALDAGVPLRDVQEAASHADPRTTTRYDRARGSLDWHATYIVAAYVAGAAR